MAVSKELSLVKQIGDSCVKYAQLKGVSFTYKHKSLSHAEVFAEFGVLPGIVKRASKMSSVCLGSSLGGTYPKVERSYLGYGLETASVLPLPLMMLFIVDTLEAVIGARGPDTAVALDEFGYE